MYSVKGCSCPFSFFPRVCLLSCSRFTAGRGAQGLCIGAGGLTVLSRRSELKGFLHYIVSPVWLTAQMLKHLGLWYKAFRPWCWLLAILGCAQGAFSWGMVVCGSACTCLYPGHLGSVGEVWKFKHTGVSFCRHVKPLHVGLKVYSVDGKKSWS